MKQKNQKQAQKANANEGHRLSGILAQSARMMPWTGGILFAIFAYFMLVGMNSDYLFTVQERSLFMANQTFFDEITATPGGIVRWAGCYLTQYFYYPALGAAMLVLLWSVCYIVTLKAFRLKREWSFLALVPVFALLCSVIGLGYWLYYVKQPGYWFAESLFFLLTMLYVWGGNKMKGLPLYIYIGIGGAVSYPLLGWYAFLGILLVCAARLCYSGKEWRTGYPLALLTLGLIGVVPLLWYYAYHHMRLEDAWLYGFPVFSSESAVSDVCSIPFIILVIAVALLAVCRPLRISDEEKEPKGGVKAALAGIVTIALCLVATWQVNFDDYNYQAEMRMYRYTEQGEWEKVLDEARNLPGSPTRQMVMLKNIALMNTDQLGNQAFCFDNTGRLPHTRDDLKVHMVQTGAPMIYMQYGKLNFATRWAIENGVEFGFDPCGLKILSLCALLSGEYTVADKYISLLEQTTFHTQTAKELRVLLTHPEKIAEEGRFKCIQELHRHATNTLDSDNGLSEIYLLHNFSNTMNIDSKLLQEVTLNYAMISKNIQLFWPRFFQYATLHAGEEMPIHYQEAAYLYGNLEKNVTISKMPFDRKRITIRYLYFQNAVQGHLKRGLNEKQAGELVKAEYGDTFWWFYFFCNDVNSY